MGYFIGFWAIFLTVSPLWGQSLGTPYPMGQTDSHHFTAYLYPAHTQTVFGVALVSPPFVSIGFSGVANYRQIAPAFWSVESFQLSPIMSLRFQKEDKRERGFGFLAGYQGDFLRVAQDEPFFALFYGRVKSFGIEVGVASDSKVSTPHYFSSLRLERLTLQVGLPRLSQSPEVHLVGDIPVIRSFLFLRLNILDFQNLVRESGSATVRLLLIGGF